MEQSSSPEDTAPLVVHDLRRASFGEVWEMQRRQLEQLVEEHTGDALYFFEHDPVITLGKSAKRDNILASSDELKERGISVFEIERGGDVTYHGPGQLVCYPLIDLKRKRRDVGWYMRNLEEVILRTLRDFGVEGTRIPGKTGVWMKSPPLNRMTIPVDRKIASLGVKLSRWCTMHGFALNVRDCTAGFQLINPCGFSDIRVTSIEEERSEPPPQLEEVAERITDHFLEVFSYVRSRWSKVRTNTPLPRDEQPHEAP